MTTLVHSVHKSPAGLVGIRVRTIDGWRGYLELKAIRIDELSFFDDIFYAQF